MNKQFLGYWIATGLFIMKGEAENPIPAPEHLAKLKTLVESSPHQNIKNYALSFIQSKTP